MNKGKDGKDKTPTNTPQQSNKDKKNVRCWAQEDKRRLNGKHRNVARKWVLERGRVQQRLFDTGWSDKSKCQACHKEKGTEKHRLYHCPEWYDVRRQIPGAFRKWEQKAKTSKKGWKWQRGTVAHPLCESQWNGGHFRMKMWESQEHNSWGMSVEGFKGHLATDGPMLGKTGKWRACGWAVVQVDYGGEMALLRGMYGSMEAGFEVQRTIKEGGADCVLMPSQDDWTHQCARRQQRDYRWG